MNQIKWCKRASITPVTQKDDQLYYTENFSEIAFLKREFGLLMKQKT